MTKQRRVISYIKMKIQTRLFKDMQVQVQGLVQQCIYIYALLHLHYTRFYKNCTRIALYSVLYSALPE